MKSIVLEFEKALNESVNPEFNDALSVLEPGNGDLVGNKEQLATLSEVLKYPETPNAMLLAEQGAGKSKTIEQFAFDNKDDLIIININIERLGELGDTAIATKIRDMFSILEKFTSSFKSDHGVPDMRFVLFADEVHKLYSYGLTGGISRAFNAFKDSIGRGIFPIIAATTDYEYSKTVNTDAAFVRRWHNITFKKPTPDLLKLILQSRLQTFNEQFETKIKLSDEIAEYILMMTAAYMIDRTEPARSLSVLEATYTRSRIDKVDQIQRAQVVSALNMEGIDIDISTRAEAVSANLEHDLIGQRLAKSKLVTQINRLKYMPRNYKKPMMTLIFAGPTGVGKTQAAKAMARGYYGTEDAMVTVHCGSYRRADDISALMDFIYDKYIADRNRLLLLDEFEKFGKDVKLAVMQLLDEGIVVNSEGKKKAINSSIVIATSNLAAKAFDDFKKQVKNMASLNLKELDRNWNAEKGNIKQIFIEGEKGRNDGLPAELLDRFQGIIPFFGFEKGETAQIVDRQLEKLRVQLLEAEHPIVLRTPGVVKWKEANVKLSYDSSPIGAYYAEDVGHKISSEAGARSIENWIGTLQDVITNVLMAEDEKDAKKGYVRSVPMHISVNTNGYASFELNSGKGLPDLNFKRDREAEIKAAKLKGA